jgi:hypothetical protein
VASPPDSAGDHRAHDVTTPSAGDTISYPDTDPTRCGATVFTRRGDHRSHGWLAAYDAIGQHA